MFLNSIIGGFSRNSSVTENKRKGALVILTEYESKLKNLKRPEIQGGGYMLYCKNKACKCNNEELLGKSTDNGETIFCDSCYQVVKLRCTCGYDSYIEFGDRMYHKRLKKCKYELRSGAACKFNFEQEVRQTAREKCLKE